MGIDARIEDENGGCIEELLDETSVVNKLLLNMTEKNSICFRFVDPYGDTTFNQEQLPVFIHELEDAISKANNGQAKMHGMRLLQLAKKHVGQPHIYLKFYGD